jgi:hypothetical protein
MKMVTMITCCIMFLFPPLMVAGQGSGDEPAAWWRFDRVNSSSAYDSASKLEDVIEGNFKRPSGVAGASLKLDGYSACIVRGAAQAPKLSGSFTIESWVALGAYPWNWCPIVSQSKAQKDGYCLAIGPRGELSLQLAVDGSWKTCQSEDFALGLRKWIHVVGVFDQNQGLSIYINGRKAGETQGAGQPQLAPEVDLLIGANHELVKPSHIHREHGTQLQWFGLDGILDELKIFDRALAAGQVEAAYRQHQPAWAPDLPLRIMPSGPEGPGRFGAYYTQLKYYEEWDDLWRVDADPDVIVRFDETSARMVFWRGARYSAAWVSGNGLWMADQSVEAWNHGEADAEGCFEHMQDRRCRYAHVRIIESNDARVVVHWRYALTSSANNLWREDEKTGRGCWVDEYYYIYPDAMGIRKPTWKTGTLRRPRQFQESLPFTHAGQLQSDVIHEEWVTIGNLKGESAVLAHVENPNPNREFPENLTIQMYNFKSEHKPFIIFEPGNRMQYVKDRRLGPRGLDIPGACNHWPVGQMACDGRTVQAADRPTHFLGFPISNPPVHEKDGRSWWSGLYGMTEKSFEELNLVAKSWSQAPELKVKGASLSSQGYDRSERAYKLSRKEQASGDNCKFELAASEQSPVFNPAFVIENWSGGDPAVKIDGKTVPQSKNLRIGRRHLLKGDNLIIWLQLESTKRVSVELITQGAK